MNFISFYDVMFQPYGALNPFSVGVTNANIIRTQKYLFIFSSNVGWARLTHIKGYRT